MTSQVPTTIVILGATGDLTSRKLIPSLFNLDCKNRLPDRLKIVGYSRKSWSSEDFRSEMKKSIEKSARECLTDSIWQDFSSRLHYIQGGFSEDEDYRSMAQQLDHVEGGTANRLYYLAAPPEFFIEIVSHLGSEGLVSEKEAWRRVIVEKPFGRDLETAQALNCQLHKALEEHQIYRIDHYLAKETVQNILVFRFGNTIFEPIWNRNFVDHVQVTLVPDLFIQTAMKGLVIL